MQKVYELIGEVSQHSYPVLVLRESGTGKELAAGSHSQLEDAAQFGSKEELGMESFLICSNSKCRYIVSLRQGTQVLDRSEIVIDECPECGHAWSSACPFCARPLEVTRRGNVSHCVNCKEKLLPLRN